VGTRHWRPPPYLGPHPRRDGALGTGLWLSAMNVQYRDIRYAVPLLVQFWMFASPVTYPSSLVPEPWRALYGINSFASARS